MLVRKFLRPKLNDEAKEILEILKILLEEYPTALSNKQMDIIKQSLYQTERTWEMEK